jgi:hypothetical protein
MAELPPNIREFNIIAGPVFAQLYKAFPARINIDREAVARAMGIEGEWRSHLLISGRSFPAVMADTLSWLANEDYLNASGAHPAENVTLSVKGLVAMNAVPEGLKEPVGTRLTDVADKGSQSGLASIGDLIGGIIGGTAKSLASG